MDQLIRYQYIAFELKPRPAGRKTDVWICESLSSGDPLGQIQWYGPWRQYVMIAQSGTVWSAGCLQDVRSFIDKLMAGRRSNRVPKIA
jgi:hypothetical protein